ncbi:3-hydroxyacyl-CoA dehydrogenase NAD-binding domain-containing protein [Alkalimarinus alittae]|uniref:3-hydroxyacyl-CoA dehydrogenase NAD-binding domain-containing protein n=1 Tax=Alkalimarinus alittae TaxID=2961619 RepID=A0ABY6MYR8_9ALTE|nr:3-hydroxyacyl-CoA dehydrogenase NAD-binding domain-containing protein [Alkalimarinus alittae]UZE94909.1 3-hydroxyacyl-CoA dehydrogenase NAD-binding domain-containing protein [Alkalimarinus alittae]
MTAIKYEKDNNGILTLTIDMPGQSANTMNAAFRDALQLTAERVVNEQDDLKGIIIASAKKTFFAGGDLNELISVGPDQAEPFFNMVQALKGHMRTLETLGIPVVAAINGAALGGGWELCLACHHRIALNDKSVQLGLPEVTLGLLPGGGGIVRTVRLLGLEKSLPYLAEGKKLNAEAALKAGLIHALANDVDEMMAMAKKWITENPKSSQPWDIKGYKIPGGTPSNPKIAQMLAIAPAILRNKTKGCYPAPEAIMSAAAEGAQVDFDTAQTIEARYFTELVIGQVSKNMIGTFWFQLNEIKSGASRPANIEKSTVSKVGVLGAGMMGAGIAYSAAISGIEVVLKDITQENADKGKQYSESLLTKRVSRKRMTEDKKQAVLSRILATDSADDLTDCDLVIEAVFEDSALKAKVTQEAEPKLAKGGLFASNTSTIPITQLAEASSKPENFVGLHFFSPVDKMPLVEIITGKKTSDETLAKAFDFVLQINKTPIVVNDSRGFFTSRVFGTFVNEGIAMLGEGYSPSSIENAAQLAGMPVGPLTLIDEVSLTLVRHIRDQSKQDVESAGGQWIAHPAEAVINKMLDQHQRKGKAAGAGFYDYPAKGKKHLWSELESLFVDQQKAKNADLQHMIDRFLFIQSIETVRCIEENVLTSVKDANIGSIFGIGYAPWTGGAIQFINQYGVKAFTDNAIALSRECGERFNPPKLLLVKAEKDEQF